MANSGTNTDLQKDRVFICDQPFPLRERETAGPGRFTTPGRGTGMPERPAESERATAEARQVR